MNTRYDLYLLALIFLVSVVGCEIPQKNEPINATSRFSESRCVHPQRDAAVLSIKDNLDFIRREKFPGGIEGYKISVDGLADLLKSAGIKADILAVEGSDISALRLARYRMIFVIDSICIDQQLQKALTEYTAAGGVLIGIGQIGRHDGQWQKTWPFGELFGLTTRVCDQWETGVSWDNDYYQISNITNYSEPLLTGLTNTISWGTNATTIYVTDVLDAKVLAQYLRYMDYSDPNKPAFVDEPIPALTIRQVGAGTAIYMPVLPGNQKPGWQTHSGDLEQLLINAKGYVHSTLMLPPDELTLTLGRNQVAWLPRGPKEVILRFQCDQLPDAIHGTYTLYNHNNSPVENKSLTLLTNNLWNSRFMMIDLTAIVKPGSYKLEITLPDLKQQFMLSVVISDDFIEKIIMPTQRNFFRNMRCGMECHLQDPVSGGFHDATGDWGVRMWSMPHVVWGLTRYLEAYPDDELIREELTWAVAWCLQMQNDDGSVNASIQPKGGMSPIKIRPDQDKSIREVEKRYSAEYTITYAAGMARAAGMLHKLNDPMAAQARYAAQKAFERVSKDTLSTSKDIGNYAWAAVELFNTTGDTMYLDIARTNIRRLLPRQLPKGNVIDGNIYGDFFANDTGNTFSPQQWKVFHSIGIYLSLIEYERILDKTDPLKAEINQTIDNFTEGYLIGMSAQSPYNQMAHGLEPGTNGQFKVYQFSHNDSWIRDHGLNCDMLTMATLALERNKDKPDPRLTRTAIRQLNWLLGVNPLGYCMITGLGHKEGPLIDDRLGTGHIRGGIPNGIIGKGTQNLPAWGPSWDSREYWLPQNTYLLTTIALLKESGY